MMRFKSNKMITCACFLIFLVSKMFDACSVCVIIYKFYGFFDLIFLVFILPSYMSKKGCREIMEHADRCLSQVILSW